MPRIPPYYLDNVCYLYDSEESARAGREFGGTGFLVTVRSEQFPKLLLWAYAVTNWHVACQGSSVIRINTVDGGIDIFPFGPEDWEFDPRFDIAVVPIPLVFKRHKYALMPTDAFLTREKMIEEMVGPGEDLFMVGRFVDHDGGQVNLPAVRFGNLSVMPTIIEQPNGKSAESFCVDLHSRSGYSGSPVFIYRTPGFNLEELRKEGPPDILYAGTSLLSLLGIHFAQFPEEWEIVNKITSSREARNPLITEGRYVKGLSGMTCVLPAWHILDVLNSEKLKKQRSDGDKFMAEKFEKEGFPPEAEQPS
jgi:hypothetical protein